MGDDEKLYREEVLFFHVVSMFQVAAMQQMGKIPNPLTNEIERDLDQARVSVDILGMLRQKTKGNLTKREEEVLGKALFESQMNYVDELKKSKGEAGGEPAAGSETETLERREGAGEAKGEGRAEEKD